LLDRYEGYLRRRRYVAWKDVLSLLRRRLAGLGKRDIGTVKAWEYAAIIERLDRQGYRSAGSMFRTRCSTFLNWCTFDARALEANPLAGYRRGRDTRAERVEKQQRGHALGDDELAAVWTAAGEDTSFGRLVRFLILTGCRRNEGARLTRDMVDLQAGRIDLPPIFTKQARGHTIYISGPLGDLFALCPIDARDPQLVFPSARTGGPMSGWSKFMDSTGRRSDAAAAAGRPQRGLVAVSGVRFTLHDLRRTFRTGLSRLGVETEIAELALGHARRT
jgi:integrase